MSRPGDPLEFLEAARLRAAPARTELREQLDSLTANLVELAATVARAVVPVTDAFVNGDAAASHEYRAVHLGLRQRCHHLEDACHLLLARQAPVGNDLRRAISVVRSVHHVERASSLLLHIIEALRWVHPPSMPVTIRAILRELGLGTAAIHEAAVRAWQDLDALAQVELERRDDDVDFLHKVLLAELYTGRQSTEESVSLALVARYFERLGDHGVEIARHVSYAATGTRPPAQPDRD